MATEKEVLRINGHEVTVTNPRKVYFPETGHTKLDLVQYYLAVADGALRGAGGRPMALKRFVDGAAGQAFFQKRAPENLPRLHPDSDADLPVWPDRRRDRHRRRRPGWRGSPTSAASTSTRTPSGPRTSTIPTSSGSTSIRFPASSGRRSAPWRLLRATRSRRRAWWAGRRPPARAGSTSTSGSSRAGRSRRCAARRWPWPATWSAASRISPRRSGGRRSATASSSTTTRTPRTGRSRRPTRCGRSPDARVSTPLTWDEVPTVEAEAFTIDTVPARFASDRRPG